MKCVYMNIYVNNVPKHGNVQVPGIIVEHLEKELHPFSQAYTNLNNSSKILQVLTNKKKW